ncbi:porin [Candidatus Pelagibacter ubique]|nr:porin [Candidatus Pelagibacter ubique]
MNNLKKIGLTALAGSLVATSVAYSGELAVSGSASMNFKNYSDSSTGKSVSMGNSVYFTGGGETDGGLNVNVSFELDQGAANNSGNNFDNHFVAVGNDTLGTLTVHGHGGANSAAALDTTAAGDLWDNTLINTTATQTATAAQGRTAPMASTSGDNLLVYSLPTLVDGLALAGSYQAANTTGSGSTAMGATYTGIEGLSLSYGQGSSEGTLDVEGDQTIMKASYAYGPITVAASNNDFDHTTATNDQEVSSVSLAYTVSDNISVSYGEETIDLSGEASDIEVSGVSVSYTSGGMTASFATVEAENVDHVQGTDKEVWKIGLSFAF